MKDNLKIFIDGACQPNPGTGGVVIFIANKEIEKKISLPLEGTVTNNIAEYQAVDKVYNERALSPLGLSKQLLQLHVHLF